MGAICQRKGFIWYENAHINSMQGEYKIGDPILHIELRRWADIVLIAPCSANTLSKVANGICDSLAVSQEDVHD